MDGRGNYSTLEVAEHQPAHAEKQVVVPDASLPQPVPPSVQDYYKQDVAVGVNGYPQHNGYQHSNGWPNGQHGQPYTPGGYYPQQQPQQAPPAAPTPARKKWMCGLRPLVFWIIVGTVVALAMIGGIVGGVMASEAKKRDSNGSGSNSSGSDGSGGSQQPGGSNGTVTTDGPDTPILGRTRIAVGNWTDATQTFMHRAVVYQTPYSLMITHWDDPSRSWKSVNISASLAKANLPITVKEASPIAIAVTGSPWPFQLSIYYLTPQNFIGEVFCKNESTMTGWQIGDVLRRGLRKTSPDTQLTSIWHRCDYGCSGHVYIVFANEQNEMQLMNSTDITKVVTIAPKISSGSGLTMIPFLGENAKNGYQPYELRLYYQDSNMVEYKFNADRTWSSGPSLAHGLTVAPQPPIFASTVFGAWAQSLVVELNPNGTLTAHRWDGSKWNFYQKLTFTNGPANPVFSAIAMNHDRGFYGVIGTTIHEYAMQFEDPYTLVYGGPVLTPKPSEASPP